MDIPGMSKQDKKGKQGGGQLDTIAGNPLGAMPTLQAHRDSILTDVQTLRERARKSIDDGAVTQSYSADRKIVIRLLNEALATEWVCVLRYYRHYFMASGMLADSVKAEFLEHAQQELAHANQISERIVQLGGEPDLDPDTLTARSHAEY
jgi:bacterioferritin